MTTLPQDQVNGAFAHGAPVLAKPTHGGLIPVHGGVVKPQHGAEYVVSNDPSVGYALYLPFSAASPTFRVGGTTYVSASLLPGYSYTRSGAKSELNASGSPLAFLANVPGIVPGVGYWSRGALTNILVRSQAFDDAAWTKTGVAVTADALAAPDGTTTADLLTESAIFDYHVAQGITSIALGTVYTVSVFAKQGAGSTRWLQVYPGFGAPATGGGKFDLTNGTVTNIAGTGNCASYIQSVGGGWYRCTLVFTGTGTGGDVVGFNIVTDASIAIGAGSTGDGSGKVYLWQAQFLTGNHPAGGPIIVTAGATAGTGADVLLATNTNPIASDTDFIWWVVANFETTVAADEVLASMPCGAGNHSLYRSSVGNLTFRNEGAADRVGQACTGGRCVLLVRRSGGKTKMWTRLGAAASVATAEVTETLSVPTGNLNVGNLAGGILQANAYIEGTYIKTGAFSDVACAALADAA